MVLTEQGTCLVLSFGTSLNMPGFPGGSVVKNLPAMQETRAQSLGLEDPLENETATHSSILAWKIPRTEESSRLHGLAKESDMTDWRNNN